MNKKQAVAYAQMALNTIQNSANGENRIKDLDLYVFGKEPFVVRKIGKQYKIPKDSFDKWISSNY